jgi:DnaK suppressor protein
MATAVRDVYDGQYGVGRAPVLDASYRPSANEEFMSPLQLEYFRQKLLNWKEAIVRESRDTMAQLKSGPMREPDLTDRASSETDWAIELRTRDRQRKLIAKIDAALRRIGDRRADLAGSPRGTAGGDDDRRGAGAPRAQRAHQPRRLRLNLPSPGWGGPCRLFSDLRTGR